MILGEDFRQELSVVQKGTKTQMIFACIVESRLWSNTNVLYLQNMWSLQDHNFAEYLMHIEDGIQLTNLDDKVKIPHELGTSWEGESSIQKFM